ncbi:hypothetical protein HPB47_024321 [Ixodes persulcatus]|uniref:Uncharacterized protein n=1 Tax=Ixodes persulcatus TaxID=34615 RepID=A0AC60Q528_IXOPE|nr:hypothetical protein HPB47_024321 [Ixodes persulcatus]
MMGPTSTPVLHCPEQPRVFNGVCCCSCCCPERRATETRAVCPGGGMWAAELCPHSAAAAAAAGPKENQQAVILVAFPVCPSRTAPCCWSLKSCCQPQQRSFVRPMDSPPRPRYPLPDDPPPSYEEGYNSGGRLINNIPTHLSHVAGHVDLGLHVTGHLVGGHTGGGSTSNDADLSRVQEALRTLRTSGYYYEGLSWQEADRLLRDRAVGTFLVRDSSDNRFLFALSVQTERGPTSARIHYRKGQFRLDSEDALSSCMPWFSCVVRLVEHYVQLSRSAKGQMCVWLDGHGRRDLPIMLTRPLYRELLPLQHLCRLALNRAAASAGPANAALATMPAALRDYVNDYPHLH